MRETPKPEGVHLESFWACTADQLLARLVSTRDGLTGSEAEARLLAWGPNALREHAALSRLRTLVDQLRSPLLLLLIFAAGASAATGEWADASIVLAIVAGTVGLGASREYSARAAAASLRSRIHIQATVVRDGHSAARPVEALVPGDVVLLAAGSLVPADGLLLEARDFFVNEAVLTGESFPVEKRPGIVQESAAVRERTNCVFLGTNVRSGTARYVVVRTGPRTEFGSIAVRLTLRPPETEFDRGLRRFGYLLTVAMLAMVLLVTVAHVFLGRPPVETLLFAVALAVGLSPELLPAILSINLARGAHQMRSTACWSGD